MSRIIIIGGPGTGKTTLAAKLAREHKLQHLCTDPQRLCDPGIQGTPDELDWSGCSEWVANNWIGTHAVIEGVAVARALRKWWNTVNDELSDEDPLVPADEIIILTREHEALNTRQAEMARQIHAVLETLKPWAGKVMVYR